MDRTRTRTAVAGAAAVAVLAGVLTAAGAVHLPGAAQAADVELWKLDARPDTVDRYVAVVAEEHLQLPGEPAPAPAAPSPLTAGLDPAQLAAATAAVGEPAALETVDGRLQLRGPRGVRVLGGAPPAAAAAPAAPARRATLDTGPAAVSDALLDRLAATPGIAAAVPLHGGRVLLSVPRGRPAPAGLDGLVSLTEDVTGSVADLAGLPNDPLISSAWALRNGGDLPGLRADMTAGADLGALGAWPRTRGADVTVAVLDTGYAPHRDLQHTLWTNDDACTSKVDVDGNSYVGDCHGWNFATGTNDVTNASSDPQRNLHGTAVGSVIAGAIGNGRAAGGIAPDVEIMPLVVGAGSSVSLAAVVEALHYAVDNGADIVNMSFGFAASSGTPLLEAAMDRAADAGVLLVASAGNDGADRDTAPIYPASSTNPSLLTVGASTGADRRAEFSAYGSTTVDVFAPGLYVLAATSDDGMMLASGTSLAAPLTAGVAALLKSTDATLVGSELRTRILDSAARRPDLSASVSGGRVDARAALAALPPRVAVDVDGLDTVTPNTPATYTVRLAGTGEGLPAGTLALSQRLLTQENDGSIYAVAGATLDAGPAGTRVTDDDGTAVLTPPGLKAPSLPGGVTVDVRTSLPTGRYVALLSLTSRGKPVGGTFAAPFVVGNPDEVQAPSPTPSGSASPAASAPASPSAAASASPLASASAAPAAPSSASPSPRTPTSSSPAPLTSAAPAPTAAPLATASPRPAPTAAAPSTAGPAPRTSPAPLPVSSPRPATQTPAPTSPKPVSSPTSSPSRPPTSGGADYYVAPPNAFGIHRITPATGSTGGGTRVMITGSDIPRVNSVLFGGAKAEVITNGAPEYLEVKTPPRAAGRVDVQVFDSSADDFSADRRSVFFTDAFLYVAMAEALPPPVAPSTSATPAPKGAAPTSTSSRRRGSLTLQPVGGVDPTLFGMAACRATCTAMRL